MWGAGWATALSLNASHKGRIEISLQQSRSRRRTATHPTTHNSPTYPLSQKAEPSPTSAPHVGAATNGNPRAGSKRASEPVEDEEDEEDEKGHVKKQVKKGGSGVAHELAAKGQTDMIGKMLSSVEDDMLLVQLVTEERTHPGGEAGTFWSRVLGRWQSDEERGSKIERTALDLKDRWCIITGTGNGKDLPADAMVRCGAASSHPQTYLPERKRLSHTHHSACPRRGVISAYG